MTTPDFLARTVAERKGLYDLDPAGESEVIAPIPGSPAWWDADQARREAADRKRDAALWRDGLAGSLQRARLADPPEPDRPADAAFHRIAGDIARAHEPHKEADPTAIIATTLAIAGTLCGHGRVVYQGSAHAANLFVALVGESSIGRKGVSLALSRHVFTAALPGRESLTVPGLGSGEGLIGHLTRTKEAEHRALVVETELGRLLTIMAREGSTLSPTLRDAWDSAPLGRFLAREDLLVTWHHVGLIAHITPVDLRAKLTSTDAANGFGNRFLWIEVRRSRLVPFPGNPRQHVEPYLEPLRRATLDDGSGVRQRHVP